MISQNFDEINLSGDSITFVVSSTYQLIMSHVLLENFTSASRRYIVISDLLVNAVEIGDHLISSGFWDEVIVIDYHSRRPGTSTTILSSFWARRCLHSRVRNIIKRLGSKDVCVFSHGDPVAAIFECDERISQKFLGEDGSFPYYNGLNYYDSYVTLWRNFGEQKNYLGLVKDFAKYGLKKVFSPTRLVDHTSRIDCVMLLRPDLLMRKSDGNLPRVVKAKTSDVGLQRAFNFLTAVYSYDANENSFYDDVDVVFFDSELYLHSDFDQEKQVNFILDYLSNLSGRRVIVKLSPLINEERHELFVSKAGVFENIVIDKKNSNIPWEVIFFNHLQKLQNCTFISQRCTACFSPYFLFGQSVDVIDISKSVLEQDAYPESVLRDTQLYAEFVAALP